MSQLVRFLFALSCTLCYSQSHILPTPVIQTVNDAEGYAYGKYSVNFRQIPTNIKDYFTIEMKRRFSTEIVTDQTENHLTFQQIKHKEKDYYKIEVLGNTTIYYTSDASCFYAVNTLLQSFSGKPQAKEMTDQRVALAWPVQLIEDYPKFQWRGLHLDVSRHFFTVDEVKRQIDLMAQYKFNVFHWHLTDDQGWRIEIKKYPKLTETGAWRDSTLNRHYSTTPRTWTVERYGGYYTQEQIKEVVQYAADRYITVVPEIEMPGHSRAALAAYPQYSCTGLQQNVPGLWGVFEDIYCTKEESIRFLQDILDEVLALFPSQYIHIGGDEAPKERWKACAHCQQNIKEHHLKDEHELQSWFIGRMDEYLTKKGRKLIGWDEILEGGLSKNAAVMSWRGTEGGIATAKMSHQVVMSPGSHCYFDHYQSDDPNEPIAIGGFTPIEKVYSWNPIPSELTEKEARYILGGQANLWTEYIPDSKQLDYMSWPRAIALAQVLWCAEKPSFEVFREQLVEYHLPELARKGVSYSKAMFYPQRKIARHPDGVRVVYTQAGIEKPFRTDVLERKTHETPNVIEISIPTGEQNLPPKQFEQRQHAALGLPLTLNTAPSRKYNTGGDLTLVDGVFGRRPWNGKEWLGFDTSAIVFTLDLQQAQELNGVGISLLNEEGNWIHLPENITIATSENGKDWSLQQFTEIKEMNRFPLKQKARYLRFNLQAKERIPEGKPGAGYTPWTFVDEIWFY